MTHIAFVYVKSKFDCFRVSVNVYDNVAESKSQGKCAIKRETENKTIKEDNIRNLSQRENGQTPISRNGPFHIIIFSLLQLAMAVVFISDFSISIVCSQLLDEFVSS